ncbi:hypothetical protein CHLRE_10g466200v5 [Chlamydomonas reinhardtii]|uniref:Cyclin N-terminal domain-containing protein n=1 Tax=Chlamydomonas reinhardtii TaxID=3055 RepID=A0A2K3DC98_CHLRE|nr:uncharacterized protein CHLRE_10g466200v5 [Chlamydomonas reinhardtii]PNW78154.1 hypothetical protein CHLRE_10g466200v5 [Chlamydomonas reinhardtii]
METSLASGKRLASVRHSHECPEASVSGSNKRSRQHVGHPYVWQSRAPAQLSSALRRVQSAPVAADNLEQETWNDLEHWRGREAGARRPTPQHVVGQQGDEISASMRATLVDWLSEVRDEFRLHAETLFLAASYLDAYLAAKPVSRGRFQLLGMACLWVAAKFEEVYPPPLVAMLAMAENMYTAAELTAMEKEVLFTLDFGLAVPTPLRFLHYMLQLAHLPAHPGEALSCRRLAEALLELSLLDLALLGAPASAVAGAAVYLALGMRRHHEGLQGVVLLSGADPADLGDLVQRLSRNLHEAASSPQPCALLCRYKAWEGLHGRTALAIAAATAAQQNAAMAPAAPPMAAAAMDTDLTAAAAAPAPAAGVMDHEVEFEAEPHAPSPPPVLRQQQLSRPSSSSAAHHLPAHYAAQQPASAHGHAAHTGAAAYHMPAAAALAAAGGLVAASAGAAALMSGAHGHPHPIHHHHVMSLAVHHVPTTATIATSVGAAAALGGLRLSSAACC